MRHGRRCLRSVSPQLLSHAHVLLAALCSNTLSWFRSDVSSLCGAMGCGVIVQAWEMRARLYEVGIKPNNPPPPRYFTAA